MKVLIVEDDPNLALLWESILEENGHETKFCHSKVDALANLSSDNFDLMVLDLTLADGSAMDLLRALTSNKHAPSVLVVTGSADLRDGELFELSPSVGAVMRKPVDVENMIEVAEFLGQATPKLQSRPLGNLPIEIRS